MNIVITLITKKEKIVGDKRTISTSTSNTFCKLVGDDSKENVEIILGKLLKAETIINAYTTARCHINIDK